METSENIETKTETGNSSGINRTGIMLNPTLSGELIDGAEESLPCPDANEDLALSRAEYVQDALTIGSLPTIMGETRNGIHDQTLSEGDLSLLLDKLGERLAFERQGTRLYETFIQKLDSLRFMDREGPAIADVQQIYEEELEHFRLLQMAIADMGGDATLLTPSADVAGVLSHGILQVISDPRSTVGQMLQALLTAELADNEGWILLQQLLQNAERADLADKCHNAVEKEAEHLQKVRSWLKEMMLSELSGGNGEILAEVEATEGTNGADLLNRKRARMKLTPGYADDRKSST
ncbi:MAG: ferritin-like domain-containing protein [Candidatus Binatia bacterium]